MERAHSSVFEYWVKSASTAGNHRQRGRDGEGQVFYIKVQKTKESVQFHIVILTEMMKLMFRILHQHSFVSAVTCGGILF